jgi:hypothetical protein
VAAAATGLAALSQAPPLIDAKAQPQARVQPAAAAAGPGAALGPVALLDQLAQADRQWQPQAEMLPGGGVRYRYRKRPGDPELSIAEIKALMADPPRFERERSIIGRLWQQLGQLDVRLRLVQPLKAGAAGEWDPAAQTLRIKPAVVARGSAEFVRVLNHEAIHVAQSCRGGGLRRPPQPLGLSQQVPASLAMALQNPPYHRASARELELEREAYANQEHLELGLTLLKLHC